MHFIYSLVPRDAVKVELKAASIRVCLKYASTIHQLMLRFDKLSAFLSCLVSTGSPPKIESAVNEGKRRGTN